MKKGLPLEVKMEMSDAYCGFCCVKGCVNKIHSHHHKLPQTNYNQKKFPLFINSPFNDAPLCEFHHQHCRKYSELNIDENVAEVYEAYLEKIRNNEI